MHFFHAVPINDDESFGPLLAVRIKYFFDVSHKRKADITGGTALNYICDLSKGVAGGLGEFCLNRGGGDADKSTKIMTLEIDDYFKDGYSLQ